MSNAATWDNDSTLNEADQKLASIKRLARFVIIALAVMLAARVLGALVRLGPSWGVLRWIETVTQWLFPIAAVGTLAGLVILWKVLARFRTWQNEWQTEWSERLKNSEKMWTATTISLRGQITDSRQAEERLQRHNAELTERAALLQGELDKRKVSEKALHEQRRELARSKDVLEAHVQEP